MSLEDVSVFLNDLKLDKKNIAFFCGSGISKNSGLPTAIELEQEILSNLGINQQKQTEIIGSRIPFESFIEKLSDFVNLEGLFKIFYSSRPDEYHMFLAMLYKNSFIETVLTTNFDTCIEEALKLELQNLDEFPLIYHREDQFAALPDVEKNRKSVLIKIHGSASDFPSIRSTLKSIANKENLSKRKIPIEYLFREGKHNYVIILGYSCSDIFDISPAIENIVDSNKEIIVVEHDINDARVEDISLKPENNPFKNYRGKRIYINTKKFLELLAKKLFLPFIGEEAIPGQKWKVDLKKFFLDLVKNDPSIQFTLSGALLQLVSDHRAAISYFQKALNASIQQNNAYNIARAHAHLGNSFAKLGSFDNAISHHQSSLKICQSLKDGLKIFELRSNLAQDYIQKGDTKSALQLVNDNYVMATALNNEDLVLRSNLETSSIDLVVGFYDDGIERLNKSKDILQNRGDLYSLVSVLGNIGSIYLEVGEYDHALSSYNEALELAKKIRDQSLIADCYGAIGSYYMNNSAPQKALEYFESQLAIGRQINAVKKVAHSLRVIGNCLSQIGKSEKAFAKYQESFFIAKKIGDFDASARSLGDISMYFLRKRDFTNSIKSLQEAKKFSTNVTSHYLSVWLMINEARIHVEKGEVKRGINIYQEAINISSRYKDGSLMSVVYNQVAELSSQMGNPQSAIKYMLDFINFIERTPNNHEIAQSYMKLAFYYNQLRDYQSCKKMYDKAFYLASKIDDVILMGHIKNGLGGYYTEIGDIHKAKPAIEEAINLAKKTGNVGLAGESYYYYSLMFIKQNAWNEGLEQARKSYEIWTRIGNPERICYAALNIGICYDKLEDKIMANEYFEISERIAKESYLLGLLNKIAEHYDRVNIIGFLKNELKSRS